MKVLVTGAAGLLGRALCREVEARGHALLALARADLNVTDAAAVHRTLAEWIRADPEGSAAPSPSGGPPGTDPAPPGPAPSWVVHLAAYTDVDGAESEPGSTRAFQVNAEGAEHVARAALEAGARLLYMSTDYVFDGAARRPYRPADPPNPVNVYGRSKLEGEERVRASGVPHLVVRTSWLYGPGGRNFVDTIRRLGRERDELRVVDDQRARPTRAASLARTLLDLMETVDPASGADTLPMGAEGEGSGSTEPDPAPGRILHAADGGEATWFELAREIAAVEGFPARIVPITTEEANRPARRPAYSVLDLTETEAVLRRPAPDWRSELREHLSDLEASPA